MHVYINLHKVMWLSLNHEIQWHGIKRPTLIKSRLFYSLSWINESCSSMEQSTWQEVLQEAGMRIIPRQRCSVGEGDDLLTLRYSTVSWRMMFPCLSMQWKLPRKNLPSLIPTSIWRNRSFLTRAIGSKSGVVDDATATVVLLSASSCSIPHNNRLLFLYIYALHNQKFYKLWIL